MPRAPLVTVLMAVYNDLPYLSESLGSILEQTLEDFELIVIDDGSTDGLWDYLQSHGDPRIRPLRNKQNIGLTRSLNLGFEVAKGRYIARMDADDIADSRRLALQAEFLRDEPTVGIVGSARLLIDAEGKRVGQAPVMTDNLGIRWKCLLGNPFAHPTVMLRRDVLGQYRLRYDPMFRTAQDYELWVRLLRHTRGANLDEPLLRYRLREGISKINHADQLMNHDDIAFSAIRRFVPNFRISPGDVTQLRGRFGGYSVSDAAMHPGDMHWVRRYLDLLDAFAAAHADEPGIEMFHARQRQVIGCAAAA